MKLKKIIKNQKFEKQAIKKLNQNTIITYFVDNKLENKSPSI